MAAHRFPFSYPCRVYYADTDAGGVVHHASYLNFMERARIELLRKMGYWQSSEVLNPWFVVRSAELQYLAPARLDDGLMVSAQVVELKRSSLCLRQQVRRQADGVLLCEGRIWLVHVDGGIKPRAIPYALHKAFAEQALAGE